MKYKKSNLSTKSIPVLTRQGLILFFLCLNLFGSFLVNAQQKSTFDEVLNCRNKALRFLLETQIDSTILQKQYSGEWYGTMELTDPYFFIGKKQKRKDSNGFTVSAIHNFLSEIYLIDTSLVALKPALNKAFREIQTYRNGQRFNFWKALPPNRKLKLFNEPKPQPLVRRPTEYRLRSRFINNAANVPEDADDTALGNLATVYHNKIFGDSLKVIKSQEYDKYLDQNRRNRNWYNHLFVRYPNSGAFLTWHAKEHRFRLLKTFSSFLNTFLIFIPGSSARPKAYKPWIPFGANDVDVVVNANVLTYLSLSNQLTKSEGKRGSIAYINWLLRQPKWANNAVYYPNLYHVSYGVARAYKSGISDLKESSQTILQYLLFTQQPNGGFASQAWLNNSDAVQSTAYALHALLDLKSAGLAIPDKNINDAIRFLIGTAQTNTIISRREVGGFFSGGIAQTNTIISHWEGGIFFSGGTALRNILVWKSDAYTTALIANCFTKYLTISSLQEK